MSIFGSSFELTSLDPGWQKALQGEVSRLRALELFLELEVKGGRKFLPSAENVLRSFRYPFDEVKVLIVGQDPYPTPGHSIGLSFAVDLDVTPLPRSLKNIYAELQRDLGIVPLSHGDLSHWSDQGVMLLNRVLTVQSGVTGSHARKGWEGFTEQAIKALVARKQPLVAILWGREAQTLKPLLSGVPVIATAHPSPLSQARGFIGSKPFSRANEYLIQAGAAPVNWRLP
ncbi:MAG: uracil-DNA glycosylase [Microbacteriaceae bacterium]